MARSNPPAPFDGLIVVDKPTEWTSHDVVGRLRRLVGTRRIGHGGTLDPMATGVLVCGIGKATKLLGLISAGDKSYEATIRLGVSTTTDDADGEVTSLTSAASLLDADAASIHEQIRTLTGDISQRPSSVSAIKVNGQRAYKRVRDGETVVLAARPVHIAEFVVLDVRGCQVEGYSEQIMAVDVDVRVTCSTGTYVRALARDLGDALGVGGHLTALRRTRVADFPISNAHTLDDLARELSWIPLADVCRQLFAVWMLEGDEVAAFRHGGRLEWPTGLDANGTIAAFDPAGNILGLAERRGDELAPTVVWLPA